MSHTQLAEALDALAQAAANPCGDGRTATVLAAAVGELESAADASLGPSGADPLVLLQRRLGRVHRLLLAVPGKVDAARVQCYLDALRCGPVPRPVAGCPEMPRSRAVHVAPATV
jgi:hypothetical protein